MGPVPAVDRWAVGCNRWTGPAGTLLDELRYGTGAGSVGEAAAVAVEAATVWDNSWVVEAAAPDLEAADEAVGAATVWINSWLVETAAAAAATATATTATATAE